MTKHGRYEVLEYVAEHPPWKVFRARRASDGGPYRTTEREVLLHYLTFEPQDWRQRALIDGARAALEIDHPRVESILTWEPGDLFCTTPLFRGWRVDHIVDESKPMECSLASWICQLVCEGLQHMHELDGTFSSGIVHRAVMARNVLVTTDGNIKLRSPGLLHVRSIEPQLVSLGKPSVFEHLSPEQLEGRVPDRRSDLFQIGLLMSELLVGRSIFSRGSPIATIEAIRFAPAPPLSSLRVGVPQELDVLISKALEKNPDHRYQTAAELIRELEGIQKRLGWSGDMQQVLDFVSATNLFDKARLGGFL